VHRFLELMGGEIEVRSQAPSGTTVHVWVPTHPHKRILHDNVHGDR
jgi:signal transduction histidine kinase